MSLQWFSLTVDAHDPAALARWWAEGLGYEIVWEEPGLTAIAQDDRTHPGMVFLRVDEDKAIKNRLHLDLNPDDQEAEVARLEALGASKVDIGQGEVGWVVMADPEGNEFCVLKPWVHPADHPDA